MADSREEEVPVYLMTLGTHSSVLLTATRPQASQKNCALESFGIQICAGLVAVVPQNSQL
jgi:hypothetical protein